MTDPTISPYSFRRVTGADLSMLTEWLSRPHWREWWGDPATELGYIRDMVEGRDKTCQPFIFSKHGEPAGYIQVWQVGPHQNEEWATDNPWLMELPSNAVGVDLSLAHERDLSKGVGSAALRQFAMTLIDQGHAMIIIDPDPVNLRAVAAYRKAGFRPVPHLEDRTPGVLIMQFHEHANPT